MLISVLLELVVAVKELLVAVQRFKGPLNLGSGIFGRTGSTIVAIREICGRPFEAVFGLPSILRAKRAGRTSR
jgi:hypothetical protein